MQGRANEIKTDLLEYGSKLIDNSISDIELEAFFTKYNGRDSPVLDIIMKNCFRYLDTAQIYQLCKRLIPLEVHFNHHNNGTLRNKTPATICLHEFMTRIGYHKKIYSHFTKYAQLDDFIKSKIDMPWELGCLYALLSCQQELSCIHAKKIGRIIVFHAVCTPVNEQAAQYAEKEDLLSIAAKTQMLISSKDKSIIEFLTRMFNEVSWHPQHQNMKINKSNEDIQYDKERFIQEMSCLSECSTHSFTTWPMTFVKTMKTPEQEDLIQRTIFFNTLKNLNMEMTGTQTKIHMMLEKTISMLNTTLEKHKTWINQELLQLTREIFLKAANCPAMKDKLSECESILRQLKSVTCCLQQNQIKSSHL